MSANALPPGYAIGERGPGTEPVLFEELRTVPVPVIGDRLGRIIGTSRLHPYHPPPSRASPARHDGAGAAGRQPHAPTEAVLPAARGRAAGTPRS